MKLALTTLMFFSYWFDCRTMALSTQCGKQRYETNSDKNLRQRFKDEYSLIASVTNIFKIIVGNRNVSRSLTNNEALELCTCVYYHKRKQKRQKTDVDSDEVISSQFDSIYRQTDFMRTQFGMFIWPYSISTYEHNFPAIFCYEKTETIPISISGDNFLLVKGSQKKSAEKQQYNIYVGKVWKYDMYYEEPFFKFEAIIEDVIIC